MGKHIQVHITHHPLTHRSLTAHPVLAGESYAGIYVPMLARAVVRGNEEGHEPAINIKVSWPRHAGPLGKCLARLS